MSSSSSSENLDYSGNDVDWDNVCPAPDTSKFSHLTKEDMQVAILGTEQPFREIATADGILYFPFLAFLVKYIDIVLTPACMTLCKGCRY